MAQHSHKRETARRRFKPAHIAGPLAVLATGAAVTAGVLSSEAPSDLLAVDKAPAASIAGGVRDIDTISRGGGGRVADEQTVRPMSEVDQMLTATAVETAIRQADGELWTSAPLNLWTRPDKAGKKAGEIGEGEKVLVTGRESSGRVEIVVEGQARWVTSGYLSEEKPFSIGADCTNGSSVPSGVSPNIVKVHEAVCANFPEITSYGTFRSDGEHSQGIAVDIMVSGDRGWQVAEFVREHYSELGVSYLIYSQRIWSVQRAGEGWRAMEDRGSTTANHYDHVHVTTY